MDKVNEMNANTGKMDELDAAMEKEGKDLYVIPLKKPITFEGKTYDSIDLTGLENIRAADMIAINRRLARMGIEVQENSMEYALYMAAEASSLPIEFFEQLKCSVAMKVKTCVMLFLFRQE